MVSQSSYATERRTVAPRQVCKDTPELPKHTVMKESENDAKILQQPLVSTRLGRNT